MEFDQLNEDHITKLQKIQVMRFKFIIKKKIYTIDVNYNNKRDIVEQIMC